MTNTPAALPKSAVHCAQCGGLLNPGEGQVFLTCPYCGSAGWFGYDGDLALLKLGANSMPDALHEWRHELFNVGLVIPANGTPDAKLGVAVERFLLQSANDIPNAVVGGSPR